MTVKELHDRLSVLIAHGMEDCQVETFDPDTNEWESVTILTYGRHHPVRIYTDEP